MRDSQIVSLGFGRWFVKKFTGLRTRQICYR